MSRLRPELRTTTSDQPVLTNGTAYYAIYGAVQGQGGLCHGKLHNGLEHCAIGSYFNNRRATALPTALVDEVAAVNDSVPHLSPRGRKSYVLRWLRWKLDRVGMKGIRGTRPT